MITERGIILAPDVEVDPVANSIYIRTSEPNAALLRHAVLYWDKIDFPQNNLIHVESTNINFLKDAGVAQTTQIRVTGAGEMAAAYLATQFAAFQHLQQKEPGMWTLGQHAKNLVVIGTDNVRRAQLAEIEINNLLPVPPEDVALEDLLAFKQKRHDEFRHLRIAVDDLCDEALRWENVPRGESVAVQRLQTAISDLRKLVDRSWLDRLKSSVKFDFNIPSVVTKAGIGFLAGQGATMIVGVPGLEYVGAAANAAMSTISLSGKVGSVISGLPERSQNYAYLYHVEKEFPGTLKRQ